MAPKGKKAEKNVLDMLKLSVQKLDVSAVHKLLESKPNLNTNFGGRLISFALHDAYKEDSLDSVVTMTTMLVKAGAKINMIGTDDYKICKQEPGAYEFLHIVASQADNEKFLKLAILMMDHGADVMARNESSDTPLHIAAEIGSVALARELIKRGADPEAMNNDNHDPIEVAIAGVLEGITKSDDMLPLLIKAGNADDKTIKRRGTLAFRYSLYKAINLTEPMKVLFDLGIPVDALDENCENCDNLSQIYWPGHECRPLNHATHWQHLATVELLAKYGADINKHSKCGRPAITVAFQRTNPITIQCLIRLGADINNFNKDNGQYPLHIVCGSVDYTTPTDIQFVLNLGADINVIDKDGKSPLALLVKETKFGASYKVIIRHVAFLVFNGKDVNSNDLQIIQNHQNTSKYYQKCLNELGKMKETTIYNDTSVFELLTKSDRALTLLLRNKDFIMSYSDIRRSFHSEYPEYFRQLKDKIELVKQIRATLNNQKNAFDQTTIQKLPEILQDKIIDFACADDIKKMKLEFYLSLYRSGLKKAGYTGFSYNYDEELYSLCET